MQEAVEVAFVAVVVYVVVVSVAVAVVVVAAVVVAAAVVALFVLVEHYYRPGLLRKVSMGLLQHWVSLEYHPNPWELSVVGSDCS